MGFENPIKRERGPHEKLEAALFAWAKRINADMRAFLGNPEQAGDILDRECRIDMDAFAAERGGPYAREGIGGRRGISDDQALARMHELSWSGAKEPATQKRYGTSDEDEIVRLYKESEKKRDGSMAEAAVICILNRFLGDRYAVVRASLHDDYENGVDTLILDKENGGVVCAFDEVVGAEGDRYAHKIDRAKEKLAKQGGMRVRYGLAFERDASGAVGLSRKGMPNIPGFCISLSHGDLKSLLRTADFSGQGKPSAEEQSAFRGVVAALHRQGQAMKEKMTEKQRQHIDDLIASAEQVLEGF